MLRNLGLHFTDSYIETVLSGCQRFVLPQKAVSVQFEVNSRQTVELFLTLSLANDICFPPVIAVSIPFFTFNVDVFVGYYNVYVHKITQAK